MKLKNHCPATGVGRFDLELAGDELKVKVKLFVKTALATDEQRQFEGAFEPLVKQHWEDKFGFKCANNAYPKTYRPTFRVKYVDEMLNSHFVLNLMDGVGGSELVSRDTYFQVPKTHTGFAPTSANLFTGSVQPTNSSGDLLKDLKASFPFYVDMQGNAPSQHSGTQLKFLAKQLAGAAPSSKVRVTAYGSNRSGKTKAVVDMLKQAGLTNVTARSSAKAVWNTSRSKTTNSTSYVKVSVDGGIDTSSFNIASHPIFTYPGAAVHEFGHMIGLVDEYMCLSKDAAQQMSTLHFIDQAEQAQWENFHPSAAKPPSAKVSDSQKQIINWCKAAGVEPPHYGQHTISVMSSGSEFLPCHYITLWSAITELTKGNTQPGDWSIVEL